MVPDDHPSAPEGRYSLPPRLQSLGRVLLRMPGLSQLKPFARKVASVTEFPGKYTLQKGSRKSPANSCELVTVMSANLWHDWPLFRRLPERLNNFARLVEEEQIDILLLQEVAQTPDLHAGEWLANRLGMSFVYTRANGHQAIGFEEGLAVLSRFPISAPQINKLSRSKNPFVNRLALGATVDTPCGEISAYSVHLGLISRENADQQEQLRMLVDDQTRGKIAVVGGDFNAPETSAQIKKTKSVWVDTYRCLHPHGEAHTHTLHWPWGGVLRQKRLDYIFLQSRDPSWQVVETRHLTTPGNSHSDHHAVLTRLVSLN